MIAAYRETLPEHTRILFDRFHFFDLAFKVVGVGSVGTPCGVALFMASDDDPLFLQVKEARASVLEPYAGKSLHPNHGQRVVVGQRIMQAASDVFLGWTRGKNGRDVYFRQLRDMKMSAVIEDWDTDLLRQYARMCAHALARAHARSGDAAMISGYMGSGQTFDDAIGEFAVEYSDQNRERLSAVRARHPREARSRPSSSARRAATVRRCNPLLQQLAADRVAHPLERAERIDLLLGALVVRRSAEVAEQHDAVVAHRDDGVELPAVHMGRSLEVQPVENEAARALAGLVGEVVLVGAALEAGQDALADAGVELVEGKRRVRGEPTDHVRIADQAHVLCRGVEAERLQVADRALVGLDLLERESRRLEIGEFGARGDAGIGQQAAGSAPGQERSEDDRQAPKSEGGHEASVTAGMPTPLTGIKGS